MVVKNIKQKHTGVTTMKKLLITTSLLLTCSGAFAGANFYLKYCVYQNVAQSETVTYEVTTNSYDCMKNEDKLKNYTWEISVPAYESGTFCSNESFAIRSNSGFGRCWFGTSNFNFTYANTINESDPNNLAGKLKMNSGTSSAMKVHIDSNEKFEVCTSGAKCNANIQEFWNDWENIYVIYTI